MRSILIDYQTEELETRVQLFILQAERETYQDRLEIGDRMYGECHAHDNQSHPRPKDLPSCLVPLPSHLLQIAEITRVSPLRNPYIIQHRLASPQPNPEHHKTLPKRTQPHMSNNRARSGSRSPHSPSRILAKALCYIAILSPFPFMYIVVLTSALPLSRSHLVP